jgi:hypothetical protein
LQAPFAAIDVRARRKPRTLLAPRILPGPLEGDVERDRHRLAADFEIASDPKAIPPFW